MAAPALLLQKSYGLGREALEKKFDVNTLATQDENEPGPKQLTRLIEDRIRGGIERNRRDFLLFKSMDWAYDTPFYQVAYTQLRHALDSKQSDAAVTKTVNTWGLSHLLPTLYNNDGSVCKDCDGKEKKGLNLPVFFNIFIPIAMAYVTIRWAKLFNDRNVHPHFKYEPAQYSMSDRIRCELLTQQVQKQSSWFDYPADTKQTILQTLKYGYCINFPREAWFEEKQMDSAGVKRTIRQGVRFDITHPSRTFYDPYHRLSSLNSNSGCEYVGNWEIARYQELHGNKLFWNRDRISFGSTGGPLGLFDGPLGEDFFKLVSPCTMAFPSAGGAGVSDLDRQGEIHRFYTNANNKDSATLKTNYFQRLVPKDYKLGDYDEPVWMRFIVASDSTVLWSEPLAYDVFPTYGYDPDFNLSRFRSLTLEVMPFQDHIGNLMSHWILAVKQNLTNPIFVDSSKIPEEYMKELRNLGMKQFSGNMFIPFSSEEQQKFFDDKGSAIYQPVIARHNTAEIANCIMGVLSMLDRTMQLSPQEVGQAASHEQTAEESRIIASNTSTRVSFTGSGIDAGDYAKKKLLHDANQAYADDQINAGISTSYDVDSPEFKAVAKELGLEIDKETREYARGNPNGTIKLKAPKTAMQLEDFASTRDKSERIDNAGVAAAMSQVFQAVAGSEALVQSIGARQLVDLLNQIIVVAGLPKEFRLQGKDIDMSAGSQEQAAQMQQMMAGFAEQVKQLVDQKQQETVQIATQASQQMVSQAINAVGTELQKVNQAIVQSAQVDQTQDEAIAQISAAMQKLGEATGQLAMKVQQTQPPPPIITPESQPPEFATA